MYESVKEDILICGVKETDELRFTEVEHEYKEAIKNKKNTFIYTIDNVALIYAGIKNNVFRIFCIYVLPKYRNNGYGRVTIRCNYRYMEKTFLSSLLRIRC